ncbi:PHO85 cyclin-5 [Monosporozyma unispora]|nr:hypothetical protein C6P44_003646 [Kazachstania unispora]
MQQVTPESNLLRLDTTLSNNIHSFPVYQTPPREDIKHEQEQIKTENLVDPSKASTALIIHNISRLLSNITQNLQVGKINNSVQTIRSFIIEILKRSKCNKMTTILASFYINKLYQNQVDLNKLPEFAKCSKRMFLICLIISHKFLTDNTYSMKTWSHITGLPVKTLNNMERWCLNKLNYELFVKKDILQNWTINLSKDTLNIIKSSTHQKRRINNEFNSLSSSSQCETKVFDKRAKVLIN